MKKNKIRVLVIGVSSNVGGVETFIMNIFRNIDRNKIQFEFPFPQESLAYHDEIIKLGGVVHKCPKNRHNFIKYYMWWNKFFKNNQFDAVYYNTCDIVSIDIIKFAKHAEVPIRIVHSHNSKNIRKLGLFHRCLEKYNRKNIKKYATDLWACSNTAGLWMFGDKEFTIIKNGINVKAYAFDNNKRNQYRASLGINDKFVVGFVGRLTMQKNPLFMIKIFEELLVLNPNSILLIIGEGEMRTEIEEFIDKKSIRNHVLLLGNRDDVNELLQAMDCFLFPSLFEGFPFALVEAQSSGLMCYVSDNISKEIKLTDNIKFVSLTKNSKFWADNINNVKNIDRCNIYKTIIQKGYDIKSTAKEFEDYLVLNKKFYRN